MLNPALTESRSKVPNSVFTREARASMSVNERASLETTMAFFPISFCADSRPAAERPVTRTRARPSRSIFAVASPMPLVPPIITTFLPWYRSMCIFLVMLGLIYRRRRGFDRHEIDARNLDDGLPGGFLVG